MTSDFKTARKKFLDAGVPVMSIDNIFDRFKKLRDSHRIEKNNEKNIDYWATKDIKYLVNFITELEKTPSKTKSKKETRKAPWNIPAPSGATKIAENEYWIVYKIEDFEAAQKLGTRNWCISRSTDHYGSETAGMSFYFLLSKKASYDEERVTDSGHIEYKDDWHRIALQVDFEGNKTFWDADDSPHKGLPKDVLKDIPSFIIEKPVVQFVLQTENFGDDFSLESFPLEAKTLADAIKQAEEVIRTTAEEHFAEMGGLKRHHTEKYSIYVDGVEVHDDYVEIQGAWEKLKKQIEDGNEIGSDPNPRSDLEIIKHKNAYYLVNNHSVEDGICEEISEKTAFLFLLFWGEQPNSTMWTIRTSIWAEQNPFLFLCKNKYYIAEIEEYEKFVDELEKEETNTNYIERIVKEINEDKALTYLFRNGDVDRYYYNPESNEVIMSLTEDGGCYKCEYEGDIEKKPKILFIAKITEEEFSSISSQEGWQE
jgi:hypothetical protein